MTYFERLAAQSDLEISEVVTAAPPETSTSPSAIGAPEPDIVELDATIEQGGSFPAPSADPVERGAADPRRDEEEESAPLVTPESSPARAAAAPDELPATRHAVPAGEDPSFTPAPMIDPGPRERGDAPALQPATSEDVAHAIHVVREWIRAEAPDAGDDAGDVPGVAAERPAAPPGPAPRDDPPEQRGPGAPREQRSPGTPPVVAVAVPPESPTPGAPAPPARPLREPAEAVTASRLFRLPAPLGAGDSLAPVSRAAHPVPDDRPPTDGDAGPAEVVEVSIGTISITIEAPPLPAAPEPVRFAAPPPPSRERPAGRLARHYIRS